MRLVPRELRFVVVAAMRVVASAQQQQVAPRGHRQPLAHPIVELALVELRLALGDAEVHLRDPVGELEHLASRHAAARVEDDPRFLRAAERGQEVDLRVVGELVLDQPRGQLAARPANALERLLATTFERIGDRDAELGERTDAGGSPPRA